MDVSGAFNPQILANAGPGKFFSTESYYPPSVYSDNQPHGGGRYGCGSVSNPADFGKYFPEVSGVQIRALFNDESISVEQYGVYDDLSKTHSTQYQRCIDYCGKTKRKIYQSLDTKASIILRENDKLSSQSATLISEDSKPAITNAGGWKHVTIEGLKVHGVADGLPVVAADAGASDCNFNFVLRGTPGVTNGGLIIHGVNPRHGKANNNCYQNQINVRTGKIPGTSGECSGAAISIGTDATNGRGNSNTIFESAIDGFELGVHLSGQSNKIVNTTFNGPHSVGCIKMTGDGNYANDIDNVYFDQAVDGAHIITDTSSRNVEYAIVSNCMGYDRSKVQHVGSQEGRITEFGRRTIRLEGRTIGLQDDSQNIRILTVMGNELLLDGIPV